VSFFSKEVQYVITSQGLPKDYKDETGRSGGAASPAVSTPSPFNLGQGRSVNSPQNESSGTAEAKKKPVVSEIFVLVIFCCRNQCIPDEIRRQISSHLTNRPL
jgi:hypothetical protein